MMSMDIFDDCFFTEMAESQTFSSGDSLEILPELRKNSNRDFLSK